MTKYLIQPNIRRLFYSDTLRMTDGAEKIVAQIHLALGGSLNEFGVCTGLIEVPRGDVRDWRSYNDSVTFNRVATREEYLQTWVKLFPQEMKEYTFITRNSVDGLSLTISDGYSTVLLTHNTGEYIIPIVIEILNSALAVFVF